MDPPWKRFPNYGAGSLGWRMGDGESYFNDFYRWFSELTDDARADFVFRNLEPSDWSGFYARIAGAPWIQ